MHGMWAAFCLTLHVSAAGAPEWQLHVAGGKYGTLAHVYARAGVHAPMPAMDTRNMQATGPMASFLAGCH